MTNTEILERVIQRIPYPEQITGLDVTSENGAIRFTWRGARFRVTRHLDVDTVGNGVLIGSIESILLRELLRRAAVKILCELISRETRERITSTEFEADRFGLSSGNPFPCSALYTAFFNSKSVIVTYIVAEAFGNYGSYESEAA